MRAPIRATITALAALAALPALASGARAGVAEPTRYISIGTDALATARAAVAAGGAELAVLDAGAEAAVLAVRESDLEALSEAMHERHDRCGGFMLHESLEEARAALAPPRPAVAVEYTLDRPDAVRAVLPRLEAARIAATIRELSSMKNRYYQSESGAAASVWLRDRWRSFTARPDVTIELVDHGYAQRSVVMTIPGEGRASEVVVIGGHLDSIALGGKTGTAPGADDDASGIATLTEVARALLAADYRPARTLKFIAYAAEEVGLRGSLSIARDYKKRGVNVVGALQLDMTNYQGSDRDIWIIDDHTSREQNAFLVRLIEAYVGATWGSDMCGYACSDHASWHRVGVPASMPFESRSKQMNRTIHTKHDTLETSGNNANHAVKFARLAAAYAIELAKTADAPPAPARLLGDAAAAPAPAQAPEQAPEQAGDAAAPAPACCRARGCEVGGLGVGAALAAGLALALALALGGLVRAAAGTRDA